MKILFLILFLIPNICFAQASSQNYVAKLQADIANQQNNINLENADIAYRQSLIAADQALINQENNIIAQGNAANAQHASGVNWDYYDLLEIAGVNWADIQQISPNVNWPNVVGELNIQCPVAQNQVNWYSWPSCEAKGVNWTSFYCSKGLC